jgi:hypothetical protein
VYILLDDGKWERITSMLEATQTRGASYSRTD